MEDPDGFSARVTTQTNIADLQAARQAAAAQQYGGWAQAAELGRVSTDPSNMDTLEAARQAAADREYRDWAAANSHPAGGDRATMAEAFQVTDAEDWRHWQQWAGHEHPANQETAHFLAQNQPGGPNAASHGNSATPQPPIHQPGQGRRPSFHQ